MQGVELSGSSENPAVVSFQSEEPITDNVQAGAALSHDELSALLAEVDAMECGDRDPRIIEKMKKQKEADRGKEGPKGPQGPTSTTHNSFTGVTKVVSR